MARNVQSAIGLTTRDLAMLEMVHAYRGCTTQQLHTRFWLATSPLSACYRRVARLLETDYLAARRQPSLTGLGSGKRFLTLGPAGRFLVAQRLGLPLDAVARPDPASPIFVQHHEAVGDFRIALELAVRDGSEVAIRAWIDETRLRQEPMRVPDTSTRQGRTGTRSLTLVPDGQFILAHDGRRQTFFLEMDMGTIPLSWLHLKVRAYLIALATSPAPVLFVTNTKERATQIERTVDRQATELGGDPSLFFTTTRDQVTRHTVLSAPVWHRIGLGGPQPLMDAEPHSRSTELREAAS